MSLWSTLTRREPSPSPAESRPPRHRFAAVGSDYQTWMALVGNANLTGRVSRTEAARVPAIQRAKSLICTTIAALPLHAVNLTSGGEVPRQLLAQPESLNGLTRVVTISRTIEDLLYESASLWLVVLRDADGYPSAVERVEFGRWTQDEDGTIRVNGREVPTTDVVLFTSPNDPLLVVAGPTVRSLLRLEATAALYASEPEPSSYFQPTDPDDDPDDDEVAALLAEWQTARKNRATAFVPGRLKLVHGERMTAEELQLAAARNFAVVEVSRLTGIDATWLGVDVSTRTYATIVDERRSFIDFVLSGYMHAVEERLSLNDVTPRSQRVRFNVDGFLRGNTLDRYNAHKIGIEAQFLTPDEVRTRYEDLPPLEKSGEPNA